MTPVIALWFSALAALPSPVARMAADQVHTLATPRHACMHACMHACISSAPAAAASAHAPTRRPRRPLAQLLFAPTSLAVFLWLQGAVEHGSAQAGGAALRAQFWQLLRANYLVWPMFAVCNFALVPPPLQVLSVGVASFFWSVYLSLALHAAPPHHAATVVDRLAALEPPYGLGHEMPATHALPAVPRLSRPNGTAAAAPALHLPRRDASRGASPAAGTPPAAGGAPTSRQQLK